MLLASDTLSCACSSAAKRADNLAEMEKEAESSSARFIRLPVDKRRKSVFNRFALRLISNRVALDNEFVAIRVKSPIDTK
jgi:hypothetical protein